MLEVLVDLSRHNRQMPEAQAVRLKLRLTKFTVQRFEICLRKFTLGYTVPPLDCRSAAHP